MNPEKYKKQIIKELKEEYNKLLKEHQDLVTELQDNGYFDGEYGECYTK
jgi:hypothetical protein